jgi:hypothetical protein
MEIGNPGQGGGIGLPDPSPQVTRLNPQQRKNFIVAEHTYNELGVITPQIDNSQNGTVHIISYFSSGPGRPPSSIDIGVGIIDIGVGQKQTYLFKGGLFTLNISPTIMDPMKATGTLSAPAGQDIMIDVINIEGTLYMESKTFY